MKKISKNIRIIIIVSLVILVSAGIYFALISRGSQKSNFDDFATCLSNREITMYGSQYCPHCLEQKKMFESSFRLINYVECSVETQRCMNDGIDLVPAWVMPNGEKLIGTQTFESLSEATGCEL